MENEKNRSRFHVHIFRLIIIIAIIFVLIKVDIKAVVKSPQFQENISYVKYQAVDIWDKYLAQPLKNIWGDLFNNLRNRGIDELKNTVDNKLENLKQ